MKSTPILIHGFFKSNLNISFLHIILILQSNYLFSYPLTNFVCTSHLFWTCHLLILLNPLILSPQEYLQNSANYRTLHYVSPSLFYPSPKGSDILLSTLFSGIINLRSSIMARDQFSHPHKITVIKCRLLVLKWWRSVCFDEWLPIYIMMKRLPFLSADRFYSAVEKSVEKRESDRRGEIWFQFITQELQFKLYPVKLLVRFLKPIVG